MSEELSKEAEARLRGLLEPGAVIPVYGDPRELPNTFADDLKAALDTIKALREREARYERAMDKAIAITIHSAQHVPARAAGSFADIGVLLTAALHPEEEK